MNKIMACVFVFISVLLLLPMCYALKGTMPLLAVHEENGGFEGSTAELTLEITEGSGRVFVDTFPLSKIDTQISMRFAKEMACDFLELDCGNLDFIYTIKAGSPIISGPSAGAAATILTVSLLSNVPIEKDISITGTINSGGLIGPVGGVKEKIEAGAKSGLKIIVVPEGENNRINNSDNSSLTLIEYAKKINVIVIEVGDLNTALFIFSKKEFRNNNESIMISPYYENTMMNLAQKLCNRTKELKKSFQIFDFSNETLEIYNLGLNLSKRGTDALQKEKFYAAASYCFGSNVRFNQVFLRSKNFSSVKYQLLLQELQRKIVEFGTAIEKRKIETITDLESYMVVKERLFEALDYVNNTNNDSLDYAYAYADERLNSAYAWAEFYKNYGKKMSFNDESLKESCEMKIAEAEERMQYASLYLPIELKSAKESLRMAYQYFNTNNFALCLFKASQSKAESDIILTTMGLSLENVPKIIENKLIAAQSMIARAEKKEIFPVLGYSYYEYANDLKENDMFSALLYAEYSLELSNLDMYFKQLEPRKRININNVDKLITQKEVIWFVIGLVLGILLMKLSLPRRKNKRR